MQCILRGGRDPFNNSKLTTSNLIDQVELRERVFAWKRKKEELSDVTVDIDEAKVLINTDDNNSELLEALLEVEKMNNEIKKLKTKTYQSTNNDHNDNIYDYDAFIEPQAEVIDDVTIGNENNNNNNILTQDVSTSLASNINMNNIFEDDYNISKKQVETSRIIDINKDNATVSMHIPGLGKLLYSIISTLFLIKVSVHFIIQFYSMAPLLKLMCSTIITMVDTIK